MKQYITLLLLTLLGVRGLAAFWPTETGPEDGWKNLPWLGQFYSASYDAGWFYHAQHGWLYAAGEDPSMFFVYMTDREDWSWLAQGSYPWLFNFEHDNWLYYNVGTESPRWFYNAFLQRWETAPLELLTVTDESLMTQVTVSDVSVLPLRNFQSQSAIDGEDPQVPFEARIGFIADGERFSETANVYAGDSMTAVLNLSLLEGTFSEADSISVRLVNVPQSDYFDNYWLSSEDGSLSVSRSEKPFQPLATGTSTLTWQLFDTGIFTPGEYIYFVYVTIDGTTYRSGYDQIVIMSPEPSLDPENIIADTGFRPSPDGFGFANFSSVLPGDLTNEQVVELVGEADALYPGSTDASQLKPIARLWLQTALDGVGGGHCLGMAATSMFIQQGVAFEGKVTPADFQPGAESTLEIQRAYARNAITYYAALQFSGNFFQYISQTPKTPNDILQATIDTMQNDDVIYFMGIFTREMGGGHAITPYAVTDEGDGIYRIYAYDNNNPQDDGRYIEIDTNANTWNYGTTQPEPGGAHLDYEGDAETFNLSLVLYSDIFEFERGIGQAGEFIISASDPAQMGFEIEDEYLGYDFETGEIIDQTDKGEVIPTLDTNAPPVYNIVASDRTFDDPALVISSMIPVVVGIPAETDNDPLPEEVDSTIDVNVLGTSVGIEIIDLGIGPGENIYLAIHASGTAMMLVADELPFAPEGVVFYAEDENSGRIYTITNLELAAEEGILFLIDQNDQLLAYILDEEGDPVPAPDGAFDLNVITVTAP